MYQSCRYFNKINISDKEDDLEDESDESDIESSGN